MWIHISRVSDVLFLLARFSNALCLVRGGCSCMYKNTFGYTLKAKELFVFLVVIPEYSGRNRSTHWLLMPCPLQPLVHQQPRYIPDQKLWPFFLFVFVLFCFVFLRQENDYAKFEIFSKCINYIFVLMFWKFNIKRLVGSHDFYSQDWVAI